MKNESTTVLIATQDVGWLNECKQLLERSFYTVDAVFTGTRALDLIEHAQYALIIVDDTLHDIQPLEFILNARELVKNNALLMVGGYNLAKFQNVLLKCNTSFIGEKAALLHKLEETVNTREQTSNTEPSTDIFMDFST